MVTSDKLPAKFQEKAVLHLALVVGEPRPVTHEGYPIEVLVNGQIYRVYRENVFPLDVGLNLESVSILCNT